MSNFVFLTVAGHFKYGRCQVSVNISVLRSRVIKQLAINLSDHIQTNNMFIAMTVNSVSDFNYARAHTLADCTF